MKIGIIKGDGIGPEIVNEAIKALDRVSSLFSLDIEYSEIIAGGASIDKYGAPLVDKELKKAKESDAVLLGAVGGPKWDRGGLSERPEGALLGLRKELGTYTNIRPAYIYSELKEASPLRDDIISGGVDLVIIRELTGGLYYGKRETKEDKSSAYDTLTYSKNEIERVTRKAFEIALLRDRHVTLVDKANVLDSSRLWRYWVSEIAKDYSSVRLDFLYVDNAAMQLVRNPRQFDVILTENMFGDILSDEASVITGSIGMIPSASLGENNRGLYEPIHGSAPDIAGMGLANPIATILASAMMLRYSFGQNKAADAIESAVKSAIKDGLRTKDIAKKDEEYISTSQMGSEIERRIKA